MRIAIGEPGVSPPWVFDEGTMRAHAQKDALRLVGRHQARCLARWRSFHA